MMRAVVVDDEEYGRAAIVSLLQDYCPDVEVVGTADSALTGIKEIRAKRPDLVFLDIEMPHGNGFDVLEGAGDLGFDVIFTTANNAYATRAFKYSAIDYLLKPIDHEELKEAVRRADERRKKQAFSFQKYEMLLDNLNLSKPHMHKISLPIQDGYVVVEVSRIIRLESDSNYTVFVLTNNQRIMVSKTLREYEDILNPQQFFRVHQSHIVSLDHVRRYTKGRGGSVEMDDGTIIEVSRRKKDEFLVWLNARD